MSEVLPSIGLVVLFVLVGGVFAAAEISLVSLRDSQARALAARGRRGQVVAELNQDPNRFLAAVQVGVTLAGFLSAAYGGATLSEDVAPQLVRWGMPEGAADAVALVLVTIAISFLSLVLGELVPKRLGLQRAEAFALALGPMIDRVSRLSRPVIWVLSVSTNGVVRLLGGDPDAQREQITDEELRELVGSHHTLGEEECQIVEEVFEAGDRQLREVMVPRTDVAFLDASTPVYKAAKEALTMPHSRYPVIRGSSDDVIGFVHVRDLLDPELAKSSVRVSELTRDILTLRSEIAKPVLTKRLIAAGHDVRSVVAYRTVGVPVTERIARDVANGRINAILVTSGSVAQQVREQFPEIPDGTLVAAIGPRTAKDARKAGLSVDVVAPHQTVDALIAAVSQFPLPHATDEFHF